MRVLKMSGSDPCRLISNSDSRKGYFPGIISCSAERQAEKLPIRGRKLVTADKSICARRQAVTFWCNKMGDSMTSIHDTTAVELLHSISLAIDGKPAATFKPQIAPAAQCRTYDDFKQDNNESMKNPPNAASHVGERWQRQQ